MTAKKSLLIVDISALAFRSHYAFINRPLTRSDGMVTSALFGTGNTLVSLIQKLKPTHIVCARDPGGKNFRHEIYTEYKANRTECPPELIPQLEMMGEMCEAFSLKPALKKVLKQMISSALTQYVVIVQVWMFLFFLVIKILCNLSNLVSRW
jgi:5'-3' exonuclease